MLKNVLSAYGLPNDCLVIPHGDGLINQTWTVQTGARKYILQKINTEIFTEPWKIAENIDRVSDWLQSHEAGNLFPKPIKSLMGDDMLHIPAEGYFRIFDFVRDSLSINVVTTTRQAYEASRKFGEFTHTLSGFPIKELHYTLPDFHNLALRHKQFTVALQRAKMERVKKATRLIAYLESLQGISLQYDEILKNPDFKLRVTHHDTKISNVLFDTYDNGICVIDLDTMMPGYFISDVGDMFRTYLSPVSEEETDFSRIELREDFFRAIVDGYLGEMKDALSTPEKNAFVYAGKYMLYMQSMRFLTDYLNNDSYYGSAYTDHNLMRAQNQSVLLQKFCEQEGRLKEIVAYALTREKVLL